MNLDTPPTRLRSGRAVRMTGAGALALGLAALPLLVGVGAAQAAGDTPPVSQDDYYSMNQGETLVIPAGFGLLANDSDADGDPIFVGNYYSFDPAQFALSVAADGSFSLTPAASFSGAFDFAYFVSTVLDISAESHVHVTVNPVGAPPPPPPPPAPNTRPVGVADAYATPADTVLAVPAPGLLANDVDGEGDALHVGNYFGWDPAEIDLAVQLDGSFVLTPAPGFNGVASFSYYPSDLGGFGPQTTVAVTVGTPPVDHAPGTNDDHYAVDAGTVLSVPAPGILANDSDEDGDALSVGSFHDWDVNAISLVVNLDGSFTATPVDGFTGVTTFDYEATSGGNGLMSLTGRVFVTVNALAVPPVVPPADVPPTDATPTYEDAVVVPEPELPAADVALVIPPVVETILADTSQNAAPKASGSGRDAKQSSDAVVSPVAADTTDFTMIWIIAPILVALVAGLVGVRFAIRRRPVVPAQV